MSKQIIRVAYADDHTAVREGIAKLISLSGKISVGIQAGNGDELITALEKAGSLPDVCILDINMPGKNGFKTQSELIERWPDIKTLVLTVHTEEFFILKMILGGARGYLLKSCSSSEIEKAVIEIHRNGVYHSDIVTCDLLEAVRRHEIRLPKFTEKEMEVLQACCSDLKYAEIAEKLGTTKRGVEGIRDSLFHKLRVNSRSALMLFAIQSGIVPVTSKMDNLLK